MRMLKWAFVIQAAFLLAEVVGGFAYNSLALLSDAAHMLADVGAIALALFAASLVARGASAKRTFGFARAEVLAAFVNSALLVGASLLIIVEAFKRFSSTHQVHGEGVIVVAVAGLIANLLTVWVLSRADNSNLNIRATMLHTLIDAASSIAVLISGFIVATTGTHSADTIAGILVAVVAIRGTWGILRRSIDLLLDAAPEGLCADTVTREIETVVGVRSISNVRIWNIGQREIAASVHVVAYPTSAINDVVNAIRHKLGHHLGIHQITAQVVHEIPADTGNSTA